MPRWSVRARILTSLLLVTAIGMTAVGAITFLVQRDRSLQEIDDRLLSRVESARFAVTGVATGGGGEEAVAAAPETPSFTTTAGAMEALLARVIPGRHESSLGLIDGRPRFIPGVGIDFHLEDDRDFVERVVAESSGDSVRIGTFLSDELGRLRYVAAPVSVVGGAESGLYLTAIDVDGELEELTGSFTTYAAVAAIALLIIGVIGWSVAGRLLRPIRSLRTAAARMTAQRLGERIPVVGRDDVSDLTETVNGMLDRVDSAVTGQRQLLDDVRHELKTPVTIIRGHLELLDPADPADVESTRALAIDELDRMTGLIDDIDALAQSQGPELSFGPVDVADLTAEVVTKASVIRDHTWIRGEAAAGVLTMDASRITQAWLQLVDNAAKYSPAGTPIEIGSTGYDDGVELWVRDEGPGIPEEARSRIFERFGRADTGRGIRGSGLGLPIVDAIATAHGGHVSLESSPAGSRFGIVLRWDDRRDAEGETA